MTKTLALLVIVVSVLCAEGQVISAKAGLVKRVSGEVFVRCHEEVARRSVVRNGQSLHDDDLVYTGKSASLVLALNPGSYLLVSEATTLQVKSTALDNMHFDLLDGEVIVKTAELRDGASLLLHPPPARLEILRKGLYRVSVEPGGNTQVNVADGELDYTDHTKRAVRLTKGRQVDFVKKSPKE